MKRFQARRSSGRFTRNTMENTLGLHCEVCEKCRSLNPWKVGESRPERCHNCNAPLVPSLPSGAHEMNEKDLTRVEGQPLTASAELPQRLTGDVPPTAPEQRRVFVGRTKCCNRIVAACVDYLGKRDLDQALADMVRSDLTITKEATATIGGRCTCR